MKKKNEIFDKMIDLVRDNNSHIHILEETIPLNEQIEYFNFSREFRARVGTSFDREQLVIQLFSDNLSIDDKKKLLTLLSALPDVAAYRAIETYHSSPPDLELTNWSAMALMESRILLSSDLTGEQQIFVSTGLGGRNTKLRYFLIVSTNDKKPFIELQQKIIEQEFSYQFDLLDIEVEKIEKEETYFTYLVLADLKIDIKEVVDSIIKECNQYGDFIYPQALITNTRVLLKEEVERILSSK